MLSTNLVIAHPRENRDSRGFRAARIDSKADIPCRLPEQTSGFGLAWLDSDDHSNARREYCIAEIRNRNFLESRAVV
jgi:hypothetical protein